VAKKLKVYRTSIGFFDLAVAAPSMRAAAEAWGSDPDIFSRGFAEQTDDPKIVEATLAAPGVVLRRPVGSDGAFAEKAALPKAPEVRKATADDRPKQAPAKKEADAKSDEKAERDAAAALEKEKERQELEREKKRQELERQKKKAEEERARKQRERAIAKADAAFARARARHDEAVASIKQRREELDKDEVRENDRWEREQQAHEDALKEAGS
jgi:colicin import membrane protein